MIRRAVGAIVFQGNKLLIVQKVKLNTLDGQQRVTGEWDIVKGVVEATDINLKGAVLRELFYRQLKSFWLS